MCHGCVSRAEAAWAGRAARLTQPWHGRLTMYWHPWRKLVAASGAIAAGGLLACAAALLDLFTPTASTKAFLITMVLLGLAVAGVVAAFTWLCGCWDESLPEDPDRAAGDGAGGFGGPVNDTELQTARWSRSDAASNATSPPRPIGAASTGRPSAGPSGPGPARPCSARCPSRRPRVAGGTDNKENISLEQPLWTFTFGFPPCSSWGWRFSR